MFMGQAQAKAALGFYDLSVERIECGLFVFHALTDEGAAWLALVESEDKRTELTIVEHRHAFLLGLAAQQAGLSVY